MAITGIMRPGCVPPGTHGEIVHRSPQLLVGYWDQPEQTKEAFEGGWFHSGDVGTSTRPATSSSSIV